MQPPSTEHQPRWITHSAAREPPTHADLRTPCPTDQRSRTDGELPAPNTRSGGETPTKYGGILRIHPFIRLAFNAVDRWA